MKRSLFITAVFLFFISGCLPNTKSGGWIKDNATPEQLRTDYEECRGSTGFIFVRDGIVPESYAEDSRTCTEDAQSREKHVRTATKTLAWTGWLPYVGIPITLAYLTVSLANISDYFQRCMEKKGYEKVARKERDPGRAEIEACMKEKGYEWR